MQFKKISCATHIPSQALHATVLPKKTQTAFKADGLWYLLYLRPYFLNLFLINPKPAMSLPRRSSVEGSGTEAVLMFRLMSLLKLTQ